MRPFTTSETSYILDHYSTETLAAMAVRLGRRVSSIQGRINTLVRNRALSRSCRFYQRPWTENDEDYLRDTWGRLTDTEIAAHLRRSRVAIQLKAKRLGITRLMAIWSGHDAARLFGADTKTILRWRRKHWLKARRAVFNRGLHRCWDFNEDEIERFIREMPWAYDIHLMTSGEYLTNVAREIYKSDPYLTTDEAAQLVHVDPETIRRWCRRGLPFQQRAKLGTRAGPWQGIKLIRRSDLLVWVQEHRRVKVA